MSGKRKTVQHSMQGVFVFVLLGLFAVMSTLMVLLGAQMYRNTVDQTTANNEGRILKAYVRSMVRAEDAAQTVSIEQHGDVTALAMYEHDDEPGHVVYIYQHEGSLYEWYTSVGWDFDPEEGTPICEAQRFEPVLEGSLLTMNMADGAGEECTVRVALRCAQ